MILLTHAYSRDNHGDGLLVDLSIELIRQAIPEELDVVVIALDGSSFSDLPNTVQWPFYSDKRLTRLFRAAAGAVYLLTGCGQVVLKKRFRDARIIVAVGGGYIRAGSCVEGVKTLIAHGTQLRMVLESGRPAVYLPQSIGPLRSAPGHYLRRLLSRLSDVALRDDRSVQELSSPHSTVRIPDLAVLKIAKSNDCVEAASYSNVYLIARDLSLSAVDKEAYLRSLTAFKERVPQLRIILQSSGRGNDDRAFYDSMGWNVDFDSIKQAIEINGRGVVVSVRLHGSLEAIINGCPSIHISYERKGYGAYHDLGIGEYVHNARTMSPEQVSLQVQELSRNSRAFWNAVNESKIRILESERELVSRIANAYNASKAGEA